MPKSISAQTERENLSKNDFLVRLSLLMRQNIQYQERQGVMQAHALQRQPTASPDPVMHGNSFGSKSSIKGKAVGWLFQTAS